MNICIKKILRACAPVLLSLRALSHAGTCSINWSAVAGGGGTSSGGTFALSGTLGQPTAAPSVGPNSSLASGFWATEFTVVQTPGAPGLILTRSGPNVILSWPSASGGFTLQSTTELSGKPAWTAVAQPVVLVGSQYQVTVRANQPKQFFRLVSP